MDSLIRRRRPPLAKLTLQSVSYLVEVESEAFLSGTLLLGFANLVDIVIYLNRLSLNLLNIILNVFDHFVLLLELLIVGRVLLLLDLIMLFQFIDLLLILDDGSSHVRGSHARLLPSVATWSHVLLLDLLRRFLLGSRRRL